MNVITKLFVFSLMNQNYGIDLFSVEKGINAVEITPLPENINTLLGVINVHGEIIPVLNIREKFNLPPKELEIDDYIIIVKVSGRKISFIADSLVGVVELHEDDMVVSDEILPHLRNIDGIGKIAGDMILIHDINKSLSIDVQNDLNTLAEIQNG